jgi:two-component system response regulator HydG
MKAIAERPATLTPRISLSICVLDVDRGQAGITADQLQKAGFSSSATENVEEALDRVRLGDCNLVLADVEMRRINGLAFLERALEYDPGMHVILTTTNYTVDSAIEAIKRGAFDYLRKPLDFARLEGPLDELAEVFSLRAKVRGLKEKLFDCSQFRGIVGGSPVMLEVFDLTKKVARHYTHVLISGPAGSGKELIARALHELSREAQGPFAVCNCSAQSEAPLESQLFGHLRGSFPGAAETRPGLFELATGGTVFLDEIGEASLNLQAKLLRVIQNQEIQRIGSPEVKKVDVHVIAGTKRNLRDEVRAGRFREDLFHRLGSIEIRVPGLVERPEDISILVQNFLRKYGLIYGKTLRGLTRRAQVALLHHDWPGNVRELENLISSAVIAARSDFVDAHDLPEYLKRPKQRREAISAENWRPAPLNDVRREHIERVLEMCNGNRVRTSQILRIGRTSLYRFLRSAGGKQTTHN